MRKQPFTYQQFQEIYSQVPRLTVEVVLKVDKGVVLVRRQEQSWKGLWHIPGGTVFYRETVEEALKRIAQEELGITVKPQKLLGYIEYPSEEQERGFGWSVGLAFLCEAETKPDLAKWQAQGIEVFKELPEEHIVEQEEILEEVLRL